MAVVSAILQGDEFDVKKDDEEVDAGGKQLP